MWPPIGWRWWLCCCWPRFGGSGGASVSRVGNRNSFAPRGCPMLRLISIVPIRSKSDGIAAVCRRKQGVREDARNPRQHAEEDERRAHDREFIGGRIP